MADASDVRTISRQGSFGPDSRIGVIGDVHAEHERLAAALVYLAEQQAELILCVGDVADGVGSVARCCELLRQYDVFTVRGNHDRWLLGGELRTLPDATPLERR